MAFLERLPKWVIVIPLTIQWLILSLRYGSASLPSSANPHITAGGLVGEGKMEYFRCMGPLGQQITAASIAFVVLPHSTTEDASIGIEKAHLQFPLIAKPDLGLCGFGVRRIDSPAGLAEYLAAFPSGERVVFQAYVDCEREAGIFYARSPGQSSGRIIGLALRYFPQVTGDGCSTLDTLIAADVRLHRLTRDPLHRAEHVGGNIPAAGEVVRLATIGSTRVGGLYRDGGALITPALTAAIDAIALEMGEFHFGRFDVRYSSDEALMAGQGFTIIEVNGAGSEAIEAWDPAMQPLAAFRRIFSKQALLFKIAAANRKRGFRPIGLRLLAKLHFRQQALIDRYPPSN